MFTGLIHEIGILKSVVFKGNEAVLSLEAGIIEKLSTGDSISVNGVCLTVSSLKNETAVVYCSSETLKNTTIGKLKMNDRVNLETAVTPSTFLGGHFVTGHVDCVGIVKKREKAGNSVVMEISIPEKFRKFIIEKGSVALDGISLTVNHVLGSSFTVNIIPETGRKTTILDKKINDNFNVECDILGKYVYNFITMRKGNISMDLLRESGFYNEGD